MQGTSGGDSDNYDVSYTTSTHVNENGTFFGKSGGRPFVNALDKLKYSLLIMNRKL